MCDMKHQEFVKKKVKAYNGVGLHEEISQLHKGREKW